MSTSSRVTLLIDALIATITPLVAPVPVYDGPATGPGDDLQLVIVGHDGSEGEARSAHITSQWANAVGFDRDEFVDIDCVVVARSGDPTLKTVRDQAETLWAAIDAALRANVQQGVPGVDWTEISGGELYQSNNQAGAMARIVFTVHARSQI